MIFSYERNDRRKYVAPSDYPSARATDDKTERKNTELRMP